MNVSVQSAGNFTPTSRTGGEDYKGQKTTENCTISNSESRTEERELIIEMMPSLRAFARSLTRNASEADDLVQETLLRALASLHQLRPGTNMKAWLFRIERNVFYTNYRKRHRECSVLAREVEDIPWIDAPQEWSVKARAMEHALSQLPPDQKEALLLVSGTGLSYEEAAEICGCALGTIKSRVSRARTRLLTILQVYHHEEFMEIERHSL
ncbi:MAG TPA: sigma-70 family RNA polymerase sigma factor [Kiloniellales bacterium]|nr:sigma-70 family RNA polymerase sigma factor [Kiloniellales bacterium]